METDFAERVAQGYVDHHYPLPKPETNPSDESVELIFEKRREVLKIYLAGFQAGRGAPSDSKKN